MMHNVIDMRTSINLDEDVHRFAAIYASARGITLSAAISELIRKAESAPKPQAETPAYSERLPHVSSDRENDHGQDGKGTGRGRI